MDSRFELTTSRRHPAPGARKIGRGDPNELIHVTIVLQPTKQIDRAAIQSNAATSAKARRFLTASEYADAYGASNAALEAVKRFASSYGLNVFETHQARRTVKLLGRRHAMEVAFGTLLSDYELPNGGKYRGRVGALRLPTELEPYIVAVLGLDNRPEYKPRFRRAAAAGAGLKQFTPQEIAAVYAFPAGDGAGQTVAIIELGGAFDQGDLGTYFGTDVKQPRAAGATVSAVYVDGAAPIPYNNPPYGSQNYTGDDWEVMLDIEVVGAVAPAANIVVYFADNSGDQHFYNAVSEAVHATPRPCAVSISWGGPEAGTVQTRQAWDDLAASAAAMGTAICVASGDDGAPDESPGNQDSFDGQRHVDSPADTPHVIACGGTKLTSDGKTRQAEVVWNEGESTQTNSGGSSGGGVSTIFPAPAWQVSAGCIAEGTTVVKYRGVPDVSGSADGQAGYVVRADGQLQPVGGTSAVAPLYAGLLARIAPSLNGQIPFLLPLFYQAAGTLFYDITQGNNSLHGVQGYDAHAGWDACSGLGSPNGQAIFDLLTK